MMKHVTILLIILVITLFFINKDGIFARVAGKGTGGTYSTYYTLTVEKEGSGSVGGVSSKDTKFLKGSKVTLTAIPLISIKGDTTQEYKFSSWDTARDGTKGACSGTKPICTIIMDSDKIVRAKFAPKVCKKPSINPSGAGICLEWALD